MTPPEPRWSSAGRLVGTVGARVAAAALPGVVRRALKRGLKGVWHQGPALPAGAFVLAPNHHSWWDGYLAWALLGARGRAMSVVMDDAQLARFAFFRAHGALGRSETREALRRLARGEVLVIYPEGKLTPPGPPGPLQQGAAFFALRARVPLVAAGVRVVLRGAEKPEAYVNLAPLLAAESSRTALTDALAEALRVLLAETDALALENDPETPLPDFAPLLVGTSSTHERAAWLEGLWRP